MPAQAPVQRMTYAEYCAFEREVSVVRGQPRTADNDPHALVNPLLLVEVLSPSRIIANSRPCKRT